MGLGLGRWLGSGACSASWLRVGANPNPNPNPKPNPHPNLLSELRPRRDHEAVAVVRQPLPELLGDIGHEGVQQPQAGVEHVHQRAPRLARARLRLVDMARQGEGG